MESAAGGVSISIQKAFFRAHFGRHHLFELIPGHVAVLKAFGPMGNLNLVAVHIVPEMNDTQLKEFFDIVAAAIQPDTNTIMYSSAM